MDHHSESESPRLTLISDVRPIAPAPDRTLLRRWLLVDWPSALRDAHAARVEYDPIIECTVVRFVVEGESWTARAWELQPYRRTWEVRAPSPEHWRHGQADDLPTMIATLASEYQAAVAAEAAYIEARAAALTAGRSALWQWPVGCEVRVYWVRWCIGADGAGQALFDCGWSAQHVLDDDGRLELWGRRPIYLMPVHLPVFEEYLCDSPSSLPNELLHLRVTSYGDPIGTEPVPWVQRLIESEAI